MKEYKITVREYDDGSIKYYDENNNEIYYKNSDGTESWYEYDKNGNMIHFKNSGGYEEFFINDKEVTKEGYPISSEKLQSLKTDPFLEAISDRIRRGESVGIMEGLAVLEYQRHRKQQRPPSLLKRLVGFFLPNAKTNERETSKEK